MTGFDFQGGRSFGIHRRLLRAYIEQNILIFDLYIICNNPYNKQHAYMYANELFNVGPSIYSN